MRLRGFSLLEMALALGLSGIVLGGAWQLMTTTSSQSEAAGLANHALTVARATSDYLANNRTAVLAQLPDLTTNSVTRLKVTSTDTGNAALTDMQTYGALNSGFTNQNSYGQSYAVYVRRQDGGAVGVDDADRLIGLVITTGGQEIADSMGSIVSTRIGAAGGFFYAGDNPASPTAATTIRGTSGGWGLSSLSSTAGWSTIGGVATRGHIAILVNMLAAGTVSTGDGTDSIDGLTDGQTDYATDNNMFMGVTAGAAITTGGQNNTATGMAALGAVTTGDNNTAFGYNALKLNTASSNTAFGYNALAANTTGTINLAIGDRALLANTTGSRNIAIGNYRNTGGGYGPTLGNLTSGSMNIAIGSANLVRLTTGYSNIAIGEPDDGTPSLGMLTTGYANIMLGEGMGAITTQHDNVVAGTNACNCTSSHNIAIGDRTLVAPGAGNSSSGTSNVAIGVTAMYYNNTGYQNVAIGSGNNFDGALEQNTTGYKNVAVGFTSSSGNTVGNQNTVFGAGSASGNISGSEITTAGFEALLFSSTTATPFTTYNTAVGAYAMRGYNSTTGRVTGTHNTAVGHMALYLATAESYSTAIGSKAMNLAASTGTSSASDNVAVGYRALVRVTTGTANVAIGSESAVSNKAALEEAVTASKNVAIGASAMANNVSRGENVAVGYEAMRYADSTATVMDRNNTAMGAYALRGTTTASANTGRDNTAVGHSALVGIRTGSYNTAIGVQAGAGAAATANTNGDYNTWVGYQAQSNGNSYSNSTALGNGATITGSNEIVLGNNAITTLRANTATISSLSDDRHKRDVKPISLGLDFINSLKPVSYRMNEGDETLRFGLIAQDLAAALPEPYKAMAEKKSGGLALLSRDDNEERTYRLGYAELTAPMLKAIQELSAEVAADQADLVRMQQAVKQLQQGR